ncbi:hypothetical protein H4J59_18505 [Colwellia sp. MB02u-10]|jgi:hypothetical protein|uniref:hypothetical protein n=1 Tax=Colwellia sp. MB02u-10 TaxID=2759828 RepID=UPI0015F47827|nr:hypothetical protein [Colwellia sp. MB02u-10]MBA6342983.1 hypothetical protein [Colwellia sp. MB02u-10]
MNKHEYLGCCQAQLLKVFSLAKNHKKDDKQKFRVEGFIHAGKALGVISHAEAVDVIARSHFQVFGESIESRQNRKASLKEAVAKGDENFINIPAYERSKL